MRIKVEVERLPSLTKLEQLGLGFCCNHPPPGIMGVMRTATQLTSLGMACGSLLRASAGGTAGVAGLRGPGEAHCSDPGLRPLWNDMVRARADPPAWLWRPVPPEDTSHGLVWGAADDLDVFP